MRPTTECETLRAPEDWQSFMSFFGCWCSSFGQDVRVTFVHESFVDVKGYSTTLRFMLHPSWPSWKRRRPRNASRGPTSRKYPDLYTSKDGHIIHFLALKKLWMRRHEAKAIVAKAVMSNFAQAIPFISVPVWHRTIAAQSFAYKDDMRRISKIFHKYPHIIGSWQYTQANRPAPLIDVRVAIRAFRKIINYCNPDSRPGLVLNIILGALWKLSEWRDIIESCDMRNPAEDDAEEAGRSKTHHISSADQVGQLYFSEAKILGCRIPTCILWDAVATSAVFRMSTGEILRVSWAQIKYDLSPYPCNYSAWIDSAVGLDLRGLRNEKIDQTLRRDVTSLNPGHPIGVIEIVCEYESAGSPPPELLEEFMLTFLINLCFSTSGINNGVMPAVCLGDWQVRNIFSQYIETVDPRYEKSFDRLQRLCQERIDQSPSLAADDGYDMPIGNASDQERAADERVSTAIESGQEELNNGAEKGALSLPPGDDTTMRTPSLEAEEVQCSTLSTLVGCQTEVSETAGRSLGKVSPPLIRRQQIDAGVGRGANDLTLSNRPPDKGKSLRSGFAGDLPKGRMSPTVQQANEPRFVVKLRRSALATPATERNTQLLIKDSSQLIQFASAVRFLREKLKMEDEIQAQLKRFNLEPSWVLAVTFSGQLFTQKCDEILTYITEDLRDTDRLNKLLSKFSSETGGWTIDIRNEPFWTVEEDTEVIGDISSILKSSIPCLVTAYPQIFPLASMKDSVKWQLPEAVSLEGRLGLVVSADDCVIPTTPPSLYALLNCLMQKISTECMHSLQVELAIETFLRKVCPPTLWAPLVLRYLDIIGPISKKRPAPKSLRDQLSARYAVHEPWYTRIGRRRFIRKKLDNVAHGVLTKEETGFSTVGTEMDCATEANLQIVDCSTPSHNSVYDTNEFEEGECD